MTDRAQYLIALYAAERREDAPVSPGRVADELDRSPSATTEMLQRLADRGLLTYEPYEGATLTAEGREEAAALYDTYQTLSTFFRDVLELRDHEEEAMELAGAVSPAVARRLAATLLEDAPDAGPTTAASSSAPRSDSV